MHSCSSVLTFLTRTSACRDQKSAGLIGVTFSHPAAGVWDISHLQAFAPPIASTSNPHSYLILYICGPQAETAIPAFCLGAPLSLEISTTAPPTSNAMVI